MNIIDKEEDDFEINDEDSKLKSAQDKLSKKDDDSIELTESEFDLVLKTLSKSLSKDENNFSDGEKKEKKKYKTFKEKYQDMEYRQKHLDYLMEKVQCSVCPNTEFTRSNLYRHNSTKRHIKNLNANLKKPETEIVNMKKDITKELELLNIKIKFLEAQDKKKTEEYKQCTEKKIKFMKLIDDMKLIK